MNTILEAAAEAVDGDRQRDYGHPAVNHGCTAAFWRAYLKRRHGVDIPLDALDVCALNRLQKESRLANAPDHRDSLVDLAGYARNQEMVLDSGRGE